MTGQDQHLSWNHASVNQTANIQESSLLTTKLFMPPVRSALVPRTRLLQRLDAALEQQHQLILVTAPPGYGKTTLAATWLETTWLGTDATPARRRGRVAWLSLDEAENEPTRFFAHVQAAFQQAGLEIGQRVRSVLEHTQPFSANITGAALIEELVHTTASDASLLLVLDDYHRIQNGDLHETVQFLVEHAPLSFHLILLTREDPPLPLARWRVQNRITELRARDLRFTIDEASEFFHRTMPLNLSMELLSLLEKRTEGWAAGLQLAALSLQDHADPAAFVKAFAGDDRQVVDYLGDEVLKHLPESLRRFLLYTSILERLCGELCEAILADAIEDWQAGGAESIGAFQGAVGQRILEVLDRRNLFLTPLDNRRLWYRYHHLFADLLHHHLQVSVGAAKIAELHRRAARWYADHGFAADAVNHALSAEDSGLAAELIERAFANSATWSGGEVALWQAWWRALPPQALRDRPLLQLRISRALYLAGHVEEAEQLLGEVSRALQKDPARFDNVDSLAAQVAVHRAAVAAMRGESQRAIDMTEGALRRLPEDEHLTRARAYDTLGMAYELRGDLEYALRAYWKASALAETAGVRYLVVNARCEAAMVQVVRGELHHARQICRAVIDLLAPEDAKTPPLGLAYAIIGEIRREQNLLEAAERALLEGIECSQAGGITDDLRHEYLFLARLRCSQKVYADAHTALQQVDALLRIYRIPRLFDVVDAYRARVWLAEGRIASAERWAETYTHQKPAEYLRDVEALTLARVWMATARTAEATALLEHLLQAASAAKRTGRVIECHALLAMGYAQSDKQEAALASLRRALVLAEPEDYARLFLDEGQPMSDLLHRTVSTDVAGRYAERLLAMTAATERKLARPDASAHMPVRVESEQATWRPDIGDDKNDGALPLSSDQVLIEPLTDRELEVLTLLAMRYTNDEIARQLVISLPTVKTHAAHIYAKLGVSGRKEAVTRARRLGILAA